MRKEKNATESGNRLNRLVEGCRIKGEIFADLALRVDGIVEGNISTSSKVVIGEKGIVQGNISCLEADVEGEVQGDIIVESVLTLRKTAKITGNITTTTINIEEGAGFNGTCKMGKITTTSSKKVEAVENESNVVY